MGLRDNCSVTEGEEFLNLFILLVFKVVDTSVYIACLFIIVLLFSFFSFFTFFFLACFTPSNQKPPGNIRDWVNGKVEGHLRGKQWQNILVLLLIKLHGCVHEVIRIRDVYFTFGQRSCLNIYCKYLYAKSATDMLKFINQLYK